MTTKRNFGLDLLRATAIAAVFIGHEVTLTGIPILGELGTGVDLFFVLSGFLIGRIYFRSSLQPAFRPWDFWRSRWFRTIPPFFAALGLYALLDRILLRPPEPANPWYYCLFLQNYIGMTGFGPSWSLCVEEHFYLLLPFLIFIVDRTIGRRSLYYVLPIVFLLPTILRIVLIQMMELSLPDWYYMTHFHCDGLIAGLWLAYLYVERPLVFATAQRPALWISFVIPVILFAMPLLSPRSAFIFGMYWYAIIAIGYSACLLGAYNIKWQPVSGLTRLGQKAIRGLALCSYSVYLTHTTVDVLIRSWLLHWHRGVVKTFLVMAGTFVVGIVFYFMFERPAILIRDRIELYRRSKLLGVEATVSTAGNGQTGRGEESSILSARPAKRSS